MGKKRGPPGIDGDRGDIAAWLALAADFEPNSGLAPEDARRHGARLLAAILAGSLRAADVELSEEFKDVLSAVVGSLRDFEPVHELCATADVVYQFISRIPWPERQLEEKQDLLRECAEIGWGAMGLTIAEVTRRRAAGNAITINRRTDPSDLLEVPLADRSTLDRERVVCEPDVLMAVCTELRFLLNSAPLDVVDEAAYLYSCLVPQNSNTSLFDEKSYFLGELALIAGSGSRLLGRRDDAELWLDGRKLPSDTQSMLVQRWRMSRTLG